MKKNRKRGLTSTGPLYSIMQNYAISGDGSIDMALPKRAVNDLKDEMKRLQDQVRVLRERIQIIQRLLEADARGMEAVSGVALRPFILQVIKAHPGKLRAADIANEVELSGYKPSGKTSARTLTYSELARLVKEGKVVKLSEGTYRQKTEMDFEI